MTNRYNKLLKQHEEVLELIEKIKNKKISNKKSSQKIRKQLSLLSGKLKIHMMKEDEYLYPELKESNDIIIKETAQNFINDMGDLAEQFKKFNQNYLSFSKILNNKEEFNEKKEVIMGKLIKRIEKENKELYPLLKKQEVS